MPHANAKVQRGQENGCRVAGRREETSRLVTGCINNSGSRISKADFYEAPEDKVTPGGGGGLHPWKI